MDSETTGMFDSVLAGLGRSRADLPTIWPPENWAQWPESLLVRHEVDGIAQTRQAIKVSGPDYYGYQLIPLVDA